MHFSPGIVILLVDFVDVELDEEVLMKSLLAGIVLVGLMAASFPGWAQDSQDSMSPGIDICALASGKNFAPPFRFCAHEVHTLAEPRVIGIPLHVLDRNSAPLSRTVGRVDVVGVLGRDSEQAVASASDQDGQMWLLNGWATGLHRGTDSVDSKVVRSLP